MAGPGRDDDDLAVGSTSVGCAITSSSPTAPTMIAGDEHDVEVRVAVAREQRPVGRGLEPPLRDRGDVVEVEPPHRRRRRRTRAANAVVLAASRWRSAVVAPVITIDSPSAMMMKSWKRSAKCDVSTSQSRSPEMRRRPGHPVERRDGAAVVDRERDRARARSRVDPVGETAGEPEDAGRREPDQDDRAHARARSCPATPATNVRNRCRPTWIATYDAGEEHRAVAERLGDRDRHQQAREHQASSTSRTTVESGSSSFVTQVV